MKVLNVTVTIVTLSQNREILPAEIATERTIQRDHGSCFRDCIFLYSSFVSAAFQALHFLALLVILLTLARRRFCQAYLDNRCSFQTSLDGCSKSIHVVREKTLADQPEGLYLLSSVRDHFGNTYCHCRFILEGETVVFRTDSRSTTRYG